MSSVDNIPVVPEPAPPPARPCPRCGGPVDVRTPHVTIEGNVVRAYCSQLCATTPVDAPLDRPAPSRRPWRRAAFHLALGLLMLLFTSGPGRRPAPVPPPAPKPALVAAPVEPELPQFGPAWPPSESDWQQEIASDAWIHPLDGPIRRMPVRDGRVFGAERPGERPVECRSGHCGVDIGGEVWGEPVHAAHDGIVDRVQRGPNDEHGGLYVRLAHRDGSIFTQYFHLAAIPRAIQPGVKVKVGDVIGLLGDSGVKHSQPHLHFTVSVKPSKEIDEQYIDPEPLIALWPLRIPVGANAAAVTAQAAPGLVHGAHKRAKRSKPVVAVDNNPPQSNPTDPVNPTE
jgi:murein DD-endopeptidase MepM/ murein hydrolase activator NlpD